MNVERINEELARLAAGGQVAQLRQDGNRPVVLYRDVPTGGTRFNLPTEADVVVPVPSGYPASAIDLAGLVVGSPLIARVKGGGNNQGIVTVDDRNWQLASYHPHAGGGGPPWDPSKHGFHTYLDHLIAWLDAL